MRLNNKNLLSVLIIDDSMVYRKVFSDAVMKTGLAKVVQAVSDGYQGLEMIAAQHFDVVLLDVFMPGIDGLAVMEIIARKYPFLPVIMVSAGNRQSADLTMMALERGAIDFFLKPGDLSSERNSKQIVEYLAGIFTQLAARHAKKMPKVRPRANVPAVSPAGTTEIKEMPWQRRGVDLVVVASSTGGPGALRTLFRGISGRITRPILVVQHMGAGFTKSLADNLDKECEMEVREALHGEEIRRGVVYLAPGSIHMICARNPAAQACIMLEDSDFVNGVKPSADVLFASVAKSYKGGNILAVVLTGMGSDGTEGVKVLKEACNCYCITQNEASSIVYGMPRSVYEAGLSNEVLGLDAISARINQLTGA